MPIISKKTFQDKRKVLKNSQISHEVLIFAFQKHHFEVLMFDSFEFFIIPLIIVCLRSWWGRADGLPWDSQQCSCQ